MIEQIENFLFSDSYWNLIFSFARLNFILLMFYISWKLILKLWHLYCLWVETKIK